MRMTEKAWALADRITLSAACHRHVLMRSDGEVQAPAIIEALPLFGGGDPAMNVVMEGTYAYSGIPNRSSVSSSPWSRRIIGISAGTTGCASVHRSRVFYGTIVRAWASHSRGSGMLTGRSATNRGMI